MDIKVGDTIYYLTEYNWECGILVSVGRVNYKIKDRRGILMTIKKEKAAHPNERVCVVWECWKGRNGRGAYRVERELYENWRHPSNMIERQGMGNGRVVEDEQYGNGRAY